MPSALLEKLNEYCIENSSSTNFVRPMLSICLSSGTFTGMLIRADQYSVLLELTDDNYRHSLSYINRNQIQAVIIKNALPLTEVLSGGTKPEQESLSNLQFQRQCANLQKNLEAKLLIKMDIASENTNGDGVVNHNIFTTFQNLADLLIEVAKDDLGKQALAEISSIKFIHQKDSTLSLKKLEKSIVVNTDYTVALSKHQSHELQPLLNAIL